MAADGTKSGFNPLAVACGVLAVAGLALALSLFLQGGWLAAQSLERERKVLTPPNTALHDYEAAEEAKLDAGYRWIDRDAGKVGVPVDRAVELVVARDGRLAETPAR